MLLGNVVDKYKPNILRCNVLVILLFLLLFFLGQIMARVYRNDLPTSSDGFEPNFAFPQI